jgi:Protein of unknown function (DUF2815).
MENLTKVVTGKVRLSFVNVFKPRAVVQGAEEKYSVTVLLPKSDTATKAKIDAAIQAAVTIGKEKWNGVAPPNIPNPIWDGDGVKQDGTAFGDECKGHWVFTAGAKVDYPPQVVDQHVQPILDHTEVYSGMYGRVSVNFFPYFYAGKKGIGCGLNNVQKLGDGTPLAGSRTSAADDFGAAEINPITGQPM